MVKQKQDDQLEHTYNSYVMIRDVALKTYQRRWTIGKSGEKGSGISVLAARHDDDDDDVDKRKKGSDNPTLKDARNNLTLADTSKTDIARSSNITVFKIESYD